MDYKIKLQENNNDKIILIIFFNNKSKNIIKELVLNVSDTSTLQLERKVIAIFEPIVLINFNFLKILVK